MASIDSKQLFQAANRLVERLVDSTPESEIFMELLESLLSITQSEYGFVARVVRNDKSPLIEMVVQSSIAGNENNKNPTLETTQHRTDSKPLNSLLSQTLESGKAFISLDTENDTTSDDIPGDHPALSQFVGLPLIRDDILIGMIGLANGKSYSEQMVDDLRPLLDTTNHIMHANRLQTKRERLKNKLISVVSHELRTPLTAVHISLSMLDAPELNPLDIAEVDHIISIASRNCERLVQLVDEILDYENLNLNQIEFNFRPVSLDELISSVDEKTRLLAENSQVQLTFFKPDQPFKVTADVDRLAQVLIQLISNAIHASQQGQEIHIGFAELPDTRQIRVFVQDNGCGISANDIDHIFEPFKQLGDSPSGGAGLGLAICKGIVEHHDSRFEVISESGKGARFQFDLLQYRDLDET